MAAMGRARREYQEKYVSDIHDKCEAASKLKYMPRPSHTMTWGELKRLVEQAEGITDDTPIWHIDISYPDCPDAGSMDYYISAHVDDKQGLAVS